MNVALPWPRLSTLRSGLRQVLRNNQKLIMPSVFRRALLRAWRHSDARCCWFRHASSAWRQARQRSCRCRNRSVLSEAGPVDNPVKQCKVARLLPYFTMVRSW
ncbi:uncharacterized protein LAESUDRAFT_578781 [Laetiporus sulphureus 93-53]|uniref:Uncharacterized protein n=1 Tax=Laetiporus sulphureus 93-53 TaxID=1314785 RepID=A0A165B001_9APHY|nr:uncharacterized protein LAESUDRAFT_578781 [Laetiporus sulphureus 93-53]KZS99971.1 hypothetical protein LAESUDRAFT_578781 [Laetiporus sulphureus 93-53]